MIRKRRGERMENVIGEGDIPIFITKEGFKLAHGRLLSLMTPSELAVLQMNFLEITAVGNFLYALVSCIFPIWEYL